MVTEILAGFVVAPFLVRRLGVTGYGLWIVIGSLGGYFSFVDFGMRGSVGRQLAACRATGDWEEANRIINTALAILSALAVLVIVGVGLSSMALDRMFEVPADQIGNARLALLLVGANLALSFPLQIFDGNLWAAQRFDVLNLVDIPATLVRIGLTFAFVRNGNDIVTLALITLVTSAGSGVIKAAISFRMDRFLAISARHIRRESGHVLFGYGWWNFVLALARLTKTQFSPLLIGSFLNVALVTPFSIARRLQDYAHKVIWTATGVLIPIATGFHARAEVAPQQRLFVEGGKYATAFATFFVVYFICLGRSVIGLWMGPQFSYAAALLIILTLGEYVQMTQSLTGSIILATARHKMLAWLAVVETVITLGLVVLVARPFGLIGVCFALAVPQVVFSGIGTVILGCRVTGVGFAKYLQEAVLPAFIAAIIPAVALAVVTFWKQPYSWATLGAYSFGYGLTYVASCWMILKPTTIERLLSDTKAALFHA